MSWRKAAIRAFSCLVFAFLLLPIVVTVVDSFSDSSVLSFPPNALTLRWYGAIPIEFYHALYVSLITAASTAAIATVVGAPAALALVRGRFIGSSLVSTFCLSPLMVPTMIIGVAAFQFLSRLGSQTGVMLGGTVAGIVLAQSAFTIPFVIRSVIAGHAHFDLSLEEAAMNLGARPVRTFLTVTLPLLMPGIVSGTIFAIIVSLDDVPVALFVGGGPATTLPVKIFTSVQFSISPDLMAIATFLTIGSIFLMLTLDYLFGLDRFFGLTKNQRSSPREVDHA